MFCQIPEREKYYFLTFFAVERQFAENFNRSISTHDLAGYLSLSVTRTCHAELFLRHTDYRIGEIAELCGFPSVEHFSRTFHRRSRMSPGQFRKSIRN